MNPLSPDEYNRFSQSIKFVLRWEGNKGFSTPEVSDDQIVNDPVDAGGLTKWGISQRTHPSLNLKNMTPEQALEIYHTEYWVPSKACMLPYPQCLAVFDTAVNTGVKRALKFWSMVPFDVDTYLTNRTMFYIQLVKQKPANQRFLRGWLARVADLKKLIQLDSMAPSIVVNSPKPFLLYLNQEQQTGPMLQTLFQT